MIITKHLKHTGALLHWAALDIARTGNRWLLMRLCDLGLALCARCDQAEVSARLAHVELLTERRRQGMRSLRRGLREDQARHGWPPRRLSAADAARSDADGAEACAAEQAAPPAVAEPRRMATVHVIHGMHRPPSAKEGTCRKPS